MFVVECILLVDSEGSLKRKVFTNKKDAEEYLDEKLLMLNPSGYLDIKIEKIKTKNKILYKSEDNTIQYSLREI